MVVVGHEAVSVADPVVSLVGVSESIQKVLAVSIIPEDGLLLIPAGGDMIDCSWIFHAEGASHNSVKELQYPRAFL